MKKLIFTLAIVSSAVLIGNGQGVGNSYACVNSMYNQLSVCFDSQDVTGRFAGTGSTLYFQSDAGIKYEQMSGCVINYNKDRITCPAAPLLVLGNGAKKKKVDL